METTNSSSTGNLFKDDAYNYEKHKEKINELSTFICKSYGNKMVDWFNQYFDPKISGQKLTIGEYSKIIHEDQYFKIITTCINQTTSKKILNWILFWSIYIILGTISAIIILIKSGFFSDLFSGLY